VEAVPPERAPAAVPGALTWDPRALGDEELLACVAELERRENELLERARRLREARVRVQSERAA
jgi:hypothetical protein